MKFNRTLFKVALIVLGVLAPVAIFLRLHTYASDLEPATGFFVRESLSCLIYNIIGFAVFALSVLLALTRGGETFSSSDDQSREEILLQDPTRSEAEMDVPDGHLHGFAKCASVWEGTLSSFASFLPGFGMLAYALAFFTDKELLSDPYHLTYALLSVASGAYFILYALKNNPVRTRLRPFFALVPAFWCTVRMVVEYRDLARFVNKTLYIGQFLFVISALLFFLYQAQLFLGEKPMTRPNSYAFAALAPAFFGITARLPQLIAVAMDRVSMDALDASSMLIDLAITFFVCVKIQSVWREGNN
ncbi:MAG: hypothetical protein IJC84_01420 [Clostridia bacterium]|nr:hypothetical protein [Clostridia bacterium]